MLYSVFNNASICNCLRFNPIINPVNFQVIALCFNPVESHKCYHISSIFKKNIECEFIIFGSSFEGIF